jgi:hypothetical protein
LVTTGGVNFNPKSAEEYINAMDDASQKTADFEEKQKNAGKMSKLYGDKLSESGNTVVGWS